MTWKEAARRLWRAKRNHRFNWLEMCRENRAARRALKACADALELQIQREAGMAHLSQPAMRALMDQVFVNAHRVLNGGGYDDL